MTTIEAVSKRQRERQVGQVTASLTLSNHIDEINAMQGRLPSTNVRKLTLDKVLVDTGATHISLPADVIEALGLPLLLEAVAETAAGPIPVRVFSDLQLTVLGRQGSYRCVELPLGRRPLLGVIPMDDLGLEPDLQAETLRALPQDTPGSYIMLY